MNLRAALHDYLAIRRSFGYRLARSEKLLQQFVDALEAAGVTTVRNEQTLAWATQPADGTAYWWGYRLGVARSFLHHLATLDPATQVPASDMLRRPNTRATPFLYSDSELIALMNAAGRLSTPLRRLTYRTLLGLLAVTGMRIGEAIALDRDHYDASEGVITIMRGKFGKTRENPLHPSTVTALNEYLQQRDALQPPAKSPALFTSTAGTRLLYCNVQWTFQRLVKRAGLQPRSPGCRPRIHDLRHRLAVNTLLDAYRTGADAQYRLTLLATYLGHVNPAATYWYLSASPELLALTSARLERNCARP